MISPFFENAILVACSFNWGRTIPQNGDAGGAEHSSPKRKNPTTLPSFSPGDTWCYPDQPDPGNTAEAGEDRRAQAWNFDMAIDVYSDERN